MANPDVHMVNIVKVGGHDFIADVGYAAPFLSPLPRDLKEDYILKWGQDRYVLKPIDANGNSQLELHRNGEHKHGYLVKPVPREIEHFAPIIEDSYRPDATFMNSILIVQFFRNRSVVLHNMSIIESERGSSILIILKDRDEILGTIKDRFSIPREIAAEAISEIKEFGDAWN
jgi:arylamine N-acetyltransferase